MSDHERMARMLLSRVVEPGDPVAARLVGEATAGTVLAALRAGRLTGSAVAAHADAWATRLAATGADEIRRSGERVGARFVIPDDPEWPAGLADLSELDAAGGDRRGGVPLGLWVRGPGDLAAVSRSALAIVGSRAASEYGEYVAGSLAAGYAARGGTVISGGAYGIDAAAHRGALAAEGSTVAVLASGIDRPYPTGNRDLLERIGERGLLVSEAAPGCSPTKSRFLVRNRLIAALSGGTLVVEAAVRSGSLNTARWARDLNRPLMGVPGPITSALSAGVNELLRQPEATLVTDVDEIIELLSPIGSQPDTGKHAPVEPRDRLSVELRRVLDAVPMVATASDASIALVAGLPLEVVRRGLEGLTATGFVLTAGGGWRQVPTGPDAP